MRALVLDQDKIIADYKSGIGLKRLRKKYHHDWKIIRRILTDNGICIRERIRPRYKELRDNIITLYNNGNTSDIIALTLKISASTVLKCLHTNNIAVRKPNITARKYPIDLTLLTDLNSEVGAYWFGFLLADGWISTYNDKKNCNKVQCNLAKRDTNHLQQLANDAGTLQNPKIRKSKGFASDREFEQCFISINSKELADFYRKSGWQEFKKGKIKLPSNLNIRHFLRGFCDGDGIVTTTSPSNCTKTYLRIGFCSMHSNIMSWIMNILVKELNINKNKVCKTHIYYIWWAGTPALKIASYLYTNQSRTLQRKLDKIMPFLVAEEAKKAKTQK